MRIRKPGCVVFAVAVTLCAMLPAGASAQATTEPPLPRNNVSGGAIAARRPGSWVQAGNANTSQRISTSITNFGGVTYSDQPPTSLRDEILPQLVQVFLGIVDQLSTIIQTIIQTGGTTAT